MMSDGLFRPVEDAFVFSLVVTFYFGGAKNGNFSFAPGDLRCEKRATLDSFFFLI